MSLVSTSSLSTLVDKTLPVVSSSGLTYNRDRNMFVTAGHTSSMGHTYFEGIQLSDRVAITYSIGIGAYGGAVFLNAVRVYCFDGSNKKLVGEKIYGGMNYCFYSDYAAKSAAKDILLDYLKSQTRILGANVPEKDLEDYACCQIEAARNTGKMLME